VADESPPPFAVADSYVRGVIPVQFSGDSVRDDALGPPLKAVPHAGDSARRQAEARGDLLHCQPFIRADQQDLSLVWREEELECLLDDVFPLRLREQPRMLARQRNGPVPNRIPEHVPRNRVTPLRRLRQLAQPASLICRDG